MKRITKFILFAVLLAVLVFPTTVFASEPQNVPQADKIVFGGTYTLVSGETLDGNLAVFGGSATVERNARVSGDVVLFGGTVTIDGEVSKNVTAMGGTLYLGDQALIQGDVTTIAAQLYRGTNTRILGRVLNGIQEPFQVVVPGTPVFPGTRMNFQPLVDVLWFFFRTLALAALAMLIVLFLPLPTERVARAVVVEPITSGGLGLLTAVVAPILVVLLAITIILIPVSLIGIFILALAILFGWIAIGTEIGKRIAALLKIEWALPVSAGIGTFIMSLVLGGINFIPCIGWVASALVAMLGVGGVILTRFGAMNYPPNTPVASYYPTVPPTYGTPVPPQAPPPAPPAQPGTNEPPKPPA